MSRPFIMSASVRAIAPFVSSISSPLGQLRHGLLRAIEFRMRYRTIVAPLILPAIGGLLALGGCGGQVQAEPVVEGDAGEDEKGITQPEELVPRDSTEPSEPTQPADAPDSALPEPADQPDPVDPSDPVDQGPNYVLGYHADADGDGVVDALGDTFDLDGDGQPDAIDFNGDGVVDGIGIDMDHDGVPDGVGISTDGYDYINAIDLDMDGIADVAIAEPR